MPKDIKNVSTEELEAELAARKVGVRSAESKVETADSNDRPARQVEAEAAKIEEEEPAISTEEATARAKEEVGHPDPFNTVKGYTREVDVTSGKEITKEEKAAREAAVEPKDEAAESGTAKDKAAAASAKKEA